MDNSISHTIESIARPEVCELPAYGAGLTKEQAQTQYPTVPVVNLSVNENPLGMSEKACTALQDAAKSSACYPDSQCVSLRKKLSAWLNVALDSVVVGNGSEDILAMLCKAFFKPGDQVMLAKPTFSLHSIYTKMMGAKVIAVAMDETLNYNLNDWLSSIKAHPQLKALMIANPCNPVGCVFKHKELAALVAACPDDTLLVVDEAYIEFAVQYVDFTDSLAILATQHRPWVVMRTFSKAYGLAGLRVGYAVVSDSSISKLLDRVRTPYNVNRLAQVAAMSVMDDNDYLQATQQLVAQQKTSMRMQLQQMGFFVAPSYANFLFIDIGCDAQWAAGKLLEQGVMVKPWTEPGYTRFIRVTIGTAEENRRFITALAKIKLFLITT